MRLLLGLVFLIAAAIPALAQPPGQRFVSIAFHDVDDSPSDLDTDAVTGRGLVQFFDWLKGSGVALDPRGFVLTGAGTDGPSRVLETSVPGVFAIGDVRSGSTKRVAAAVGEGAQVVAALHTFLADSARQPTKARARRA